MKYVWNYNKLKFEIISVFVKVFYFKLGNIVGEGKGE